MPWKGDVQIVGPHGASTSNHGPALATSGVLRVFLAYAGTNGFVYWSWIDLDPDTETFSSWQGDEQVKWGGTTALHTASSPALTRLDKGYPALFTLSPNNDDLLVSYFDGHLWHGYSLGALFPQPRRLVSVSATTAGNEVHVMVVDAQQGLTHLRAIAPITSASQWLRLTETDLLYGPTISFNKAGDPLFRVNGNRYARYDLDPKLGLYSSTPTAKGLLVVGNGSPEIAPGGAIGFWSGGQQLLYQAQGEDLLYTATVAASPNSVGNLFLGASEPLKTSVVQIKTDQPISAFAPVERLVCMAHKGNGNNKLYFSYRPDA